MPGAGPLSVGDFPKLYNSRLAYIRELIGPDAWPEADQQWERYFDVQNSDRMREEFLTYGGFGLFRQMAENTKVQYDQILQGPSQAISHVLYGLGYQIGYLAAKWDIDSIIARNAPELGRALRVSIQTLAAGFWNGAFDTYTTPDGQTYFSASHTLLRGGGTWANRTSPDTAFGQSALENALVAFQRMKDPMGNPMPLPVETLLIPPELEPLSYELLQSRWRSDTTTHAESYTYNKVTPETWPFLTISTAWMLLGPKAQRKVKWFWSVRPETSHGYDFDSETAKTKTLFAASFGAQDGRGVYGSKGV